MRWMIPLFVFTLLLSGCMQEEKESLPEEPVKITPSTTKLTSIEYIQTIDEYTENMQKEFKTLEGVYNDPSIEDYTEKNIKQAKQIISGAQKYEALNPPAELEQAHQDIVASMKMYQEAMQLLIKGMEERDSDLLSDTVIRMNEARELFNKAIQTDSILNAREEHTTLANGMKAMDNMAGIDRESVRQNLSEDGHELAGKWGSAQDDTFKILIVLNEDGSYKRYKQYPDESSVIIGRWGYNQEDGSLVLYNDEAYENGDSIIDQVRSKLIHEIQYFDGKELQIMDAETYHTARYSRGD